MLAFWEISIKKALGKLTAPDNLAKAIAASYFETLSITVEHGMAAGKLPDYHKDPFIDLL